MFQVVYQAPGASAIVLGLYSDREQLKRAIPLFLDAAFKADGKVWDVKVQRLWEGGR